MYFNKNIVEHCRMSIPFLGIKAATSYLLPLFFFRWSRWRRIFSNGQIFEWKNVSCFNWNFEKPAFGPVKNTRVYNIINGTVLFFEVEEIVGFLRVQRYNISVGHSCIKYFKILADSYRLLGHCLYIFKIKITITFTVFTHRNFVSLLKLLIKVEI